MYKTERLVRQELSEYLYAHFGIEHLMAKDLLIENAISAIMSMFDDVPDNWAKIDGKWVEIPDRHFITFDPTGWFIEHSLPCRIRGLQNCWFNTMASAIGDLLPDGRYEILSDGKIVEIGNE